MIRITNEEYIEIRRDDLEGKIDIEITVATQEDNAAKVEQLSFLLQTIGPSEDPAIRRDLMADIYELSKLPKQAKRLREYQPQISPEQKRLQELELNRLELENKILEAEINKLYSESQENAGDLLEKQMRARVEAAKAAKLENEARLAGERADLESLKFLKQDNQIDEQSKLQELQVKHQYEMEKKKYDADLSMAQMMLQARQGGANEQIGVPR